MNARATPASDRLPTLAHVLRALAVLIALVGALDPRLRRERRGTPTVAVLRADTLRHDRAFIAVRDRLRAAGVRVTTAAGTHDAARVVVGAALPATLPVDRTPAVVYAPTVGSITQLSVPTRAPLAAPTTVAVAFSARVAGPVTVQLAEQGVVLATATRTVRAGEPQTLSLSWTPARTGVHALTALVIANGPPQDTVRATRAVRVDSLPWRVLAWDARPSYLATFVRRALVRDPRFAVQSRVLTTRAPTATVTRATANVPTSLAAVDPQRIDVLVIGAPDALTAGESQVVERLVRDVGLPVVLLADQTGGALLRSLGGVNAWRATPRQTAVALASATDSVALRGLAFASPGVLPRDAEPLVRAGSAAVAWRQPVGRGEVVISTAFDAWRFRDPAQSAFDVTWRDVIASAAARRPPAVAVAPASAMVAPGERVPLMIYSAIRPTLARVDSAGREQALAVHATAAPDAWVAMVPSVPTTTVSGDAQLVARAGRDSAVMPLVIDPTAGRDLDDPPEVVHAWAEAHGGRVVGTVDSVSAAVLATQNAQPQPLPWHPMRSPWWIVPFTLALGGDWWLRRRNGRA